MYTSDNKICFLPNLEIYTLYPVFPYCTSNMFLLECLGLFSSLGATRLTRFFRPHGPLLPSTSHSNSTLCHTWQPSKSLRLFHLSEISTRGDWNLRLLSIDEYLFPFLGHHLIFLTTRLNERTNDVLLAMLSSDIRRNSLVRRYCVKIMSKRVPTDKYVLSPRVCCINMGLRKKFQKSEITNEVGGWVQLGILCVWKIVPK